MNRNVLSFLAFWVISSVFQLYAGDNPNPNESFALANQFYEKGELDKAGEIYQSLAKQGFESAELYYNLANWHYRKGEKGKAVLWYERAHRLSPRDADIQFNLMLARSHIKDEDENVFMKTFSFFNGNELAVFLSIFLWLFFFFMGLRVWGSVGQRQWGNPVTWLLGFMFFFFLAWFGVAVSIETQPMGIVVGPPGEVRNGPGTDYAVGFTIPEGAKVLILNKRPDWTQIGVQNQGLKGWIPNGEIESIQINSGSLG